MAIRNVAAGALTENMTLALFELMAWTQHAWSMHEDHLARSVFAIRLTDIVLKKSKKTRNRMFGS